MPTDPSCLSHILAILDRTAEALGKMGAGDIARATFQDGVRRGELAALMQAGARFVDAAPSATSTMSEEPTP